MAVRGVEGVESLWAGLNLVTMAVCLAFCGEDMDVVYGDEHMCILYTCTTTLPYLLSFVECFTPWLTSSVLPVFHIGLGLEEQDGVDGGLLEGTHRHC
jgi:hypothetical protein